MKLHPLTVALSQKLLLLFLEAGPLDWLDELGAGGAKLTSVEFAENVKEENRSEQT